MLDLANPSTSPRPDERSHAWVAGLFAVGLGALLVTTWMVYRPGIHGEFLLDDFSNLSMLGASGGVTNWDAFWRYITSGTADPTGRPLSLLAFLLDANDWPASAAPFKATNILLHLLNGMLLCWTMLKLARFRYMSQKKAATAALIGSGLWLLHPLLVSTTLYVVQREAMLAATFMLAGILCWCTGREALDGSKNVRALIWMAAGAWGCTLLASLCKPNGMLLPLLLAAAELTVLRVSATRCVHGQRRPLVLNAILLGIPITLIALYLAYLLPGFIRTTPGIRGWTIGERLLSEPRVLIGYLQLLWIPRSTSFGVFDDQIHVSTSLLHPWTTLPCIILVVGLVATGWMTRRRYPAVAFAILFYFAGQVFESSIIPLQLAFEHRNYLPAAFMFWPLGLWTSNRTSRPLLARAIVVVALCVLAAMTWVRAGVWGNLQLQGRLWGQINPYSPQAQSFSAAVEVASGNTDAAVARLRAALRRMPDQPQLALRLIDAECKQGTIQTTSWSMAASSLRNANTGWNNIANWFITSIPEATSHQCNGMSINDIADALAALKANASFMRWHQDDPAFARVDAIMDLAKGQPQKAIARYDRMFDDSAGRASLIEQAKALAAYGYPKLALQHLEHHASFGSSPQGFGMLRLHDWVLRRQDWWPREFAGLRTILEQQIRSQRLHVDRQ